MRKSEVCRRKGETRGTKEGVLGRRRKERSATENLEEKVRG